MIRAIIADDEAVILKGLKKLIDWKGLGIDLVGEASDGQEALRLILEKQPQLAISDISMPGLTGLEMLKKVKEQKVPTQVIFVSGYQEFSYARDAVKYGAVDYLLKPVEPEELILALQKAMGQIDDQNRLTLLTTTEKEDKVYQIFQKINGSQEYAREDLYEQFSNMNIDINGKQFLGVAFRLYLRKGNQTPQRMQELVKFAAYNKIQKLLEERQWGFVVKKDTNTCYVMLLLEGQDGQAQAESRVRKLIAAAGESQQLAIKCGVGERVEDIAALDLAYKTSRFALELYYFTEEDVVWYDRVQKEFLQSFDSYQEGCRKLLAVFLNGRPSVREEAGQVLEVIRSLHFGNRFAAVNRCNLMVSELTQELCKGYLLEESWLREQEKHIEELRTKPTYRQACACVTDYLERMLAEAKKGGNRDFNETARIRQYVEEHFRENLTLESMAQVVNMNPYYFSSYFKKHMGENFKNYLTDVRMKEAARLLVRTDYKSYEVAEAVGYKNVRQFNENFKGKYGKSPNEYRKEQRK